jgi:hypothetical protein
VASDAAFFVGPDDSVRLPIEEKIVAFDDARCREDVKNGTSNDV